MKVMKFACPVCNRLLERTKKSHYCDKCRYHWPVENGVPDFTTSDSYWGEIPQHEMQRVNRIARKEGWQKALVEVIYPRYPSIYGYIMHASRADWWFVLPQNLSATVLDVGSGWGSLSFLLAEIYSHVYSLENVKERVEFQNIRCLQDNVRNVSIARGDVFSMPFLPESFDLVVMNGLLEWLGVNPMFKDPRNAQLVGLKKCHTLLKYGGSLYIGIENRFAYSYFLGKKDHSGLPFTSLMPRWIADICCKVCDAGYYYGCNSRGYETYTYSYWGYKKVLAMAGFSDVQVYCCLPDYNDPRYILPLGRRNLLRFFFSNLLPQNTKKREIIKSFGRLPMALDVYRFLSPCFSIVARK
jgi:SAM-dependent methyltransferase